MARFKSLVIVSHGRSGSTLLQGILNTAPGFLVRGENHNFIEGFHIAYKRIERAQRQKPHTNAATHAFYGIHTFSADRMLAELARVVRNMLVPHHQRETIACYGFKEIRYPLSDPQFTDYMTFLRKLMPNLAIVLNTRAHESIAGSGWWADKPISDITRQLAAADAVRTDYVGRNPEHAFHIRYEDVCAQGPQLAALFEFLGAEYLPERIAATLATPHSTSKRPKNEMPSNTNLPEHLKDDKENAGSE